MPLLSPEEEIDLAIRISNDDKEAKEILPKANLRLRFGLRDGTPQTLEEVGKAFNVTRERIRQIEAKALRKLRHPSRSKHLKDL